MKKNAMTFILAGSIVLIMTQLFGTDLQPVSAAEFPTRPIRIIVPFPPGGGSDILARAVSQRLSQILGQQAIVDNRGGASGQIGYELSANALPDGYTMFLASFGQLTALPLLQGRGKIDPVRDFSAVTLLASAPFILVANPTVPVKSLKELVARAKEKPGELNYGSPGSGSSPHLAAELFKFATSTNIMHVPYKGAGPATIDLLAGQLQIVFSTMPPIMTHVKSGKLRALGVTSLKRAAELPDVPTIDEACSPGFEMLHWYGMVVPKKTPDEIVQKLNRALLEVLKIPEVISMLALQGLEPAGCTSEQFSKFIQLELEKYGRIVKEAKIVQQ
jgi:tripartite-type tricarboxylate transporter receptor subunit TctC